MMAILNETFNSHPIKHDQQRVSTRLYESPSKACERVMVKRQTNIGSQPPPAPQARIENGETDWREEMVEQIKPLKAAYLSMFTELDEKLVIPKLPEEYMRSLSGEEARNYIHRLSTKCYVDGILRFLHLERTQIPETYKGQLPKYKRAIEYHSVLKRKACAEEMKKRKQKVSADKRVGKMEQTVVTTPSADQKNHTNQWQGLRSPCFSMKSPVVLQPSTANDVEWQCMPPTIAKSGVVSPTVKVDVVTGSPCESMFAAAPFDYDSFSLLHKVQQSSSRWFQEEYKATATKLVTPAPPCQAQTSAGQTECQVDSRTETHVAKKPIDRLVAAVRSSSPAMLNRTANLMQLAVRDMDSVFLQTKDEPNVACSECCSVKQRKTQDDKEDVMDEINKINSRLIDTEISICRDNIEDGALIKLSYTATAIGPHLRSHFTTLGMQSTVKPLKLLIPPEYPRSSPVMVDEEEDGAVRTTIKMDSAFRLSLSKLPEPRSLKQIANVWDECVRHAVKEYAERLGGGSVRSTLGRWEGCVGS